MVPNRLVNCKVNGFSVWAPGWIKLCLSLQDRDDNILTCYFWGFVVDIYSQGTMLQRTKIWCSLIVSKRGIQIAWVKFKIWREYPRRIWCIIVYLNCCAEQWLKRKLIQLSKTNLFSIIQIPSKGYFYHAHSPGIELGVRVWLTIRGKFTTGSTSSPGRIRTPTNEEGRCEAAKVH